MLTPRSASFSAIPRPIPRELPVTSARFPCSGMSTSYASVFSSQAGHGRTAKRLLFLESHVLVRGGEGVAGDQPEARLLHSRPVAAHQADLEDGRDHRLLVDQLLDALQHRLAPLLVE